MYSDSLAHLGETSAKTSWRFDHDALAPSDEVPAHLVDSTRPESYRQCSIFVPGARLARMEEEVRRIARRVCVESKPHIDRGFLERPERTSGIASKIERRAPLERLVQDPCATHAVEPPEPRFLFPVGPTNEECPVPVKHAVRFDTLAARSSGRSSPVIELDHAPLPECISQQGDETFLKAHPRARAHRESVCTKEHLERGFSIDFPTRTPHRTELVREIPESVPALGQARTVQPLGRRLELGEFGQRDADELTQGVGPKPPMPLPVPGRYLVEGPEALLDRISEAFGRSPAHAKLRTDFVEGQPLASWEVQKSLGSSGGAILVLDGRRALEHGVCSFNRWYQLHLTPRNFALPSPGGPS